jgi:hypothetical protein
MPTVTEPEPTSSRRAVDYKGAPLDAEKGPGLGCFWSQIVVLVGLLVLTPLSVTWRWPAAVSAGLLIAVLILLLVAGQTVIFLLRLVAADRRAAGRRRPLGSNSPTVGELEDRQRAAAAAGGDEPPETPLGGVRE